MVSKSVHRKYNIDKFQAPKIDDDEKIKAHLKALGYMD